MAAILVASAGWVAGAPAGCDVCADVRDEYCSLWPTSDVCSRPCGFKWSHEMRRCTMETVHKGMTTSDTPIIGGQGKYRCVLPPPLPHRGTRPRVWSRASPPPTNHFDLGVASTHLFLLPQHDLSDAGPLPQEGSSPHSRIQPEVAAAVAAS